MEIETHRMFLQRKQGFTLLEMLTVIAIIIIMVGIIRPSIINSTTKAREHECESRLTQVGMAIQAYVHDYGQFPEQLADVNVTLRNRSLLQCPATDEDYSYQKPATAPSVHDVIVSCVDPQRALDNPPHRSRTSYLSLTAGGAVILETKN